MYDFGTLLEIGGSALGIYSSIEQSKAAKEAGKRGAAAELSAAEANRALSYYDASVAEKDALEIEYQMGVALEVHKQTVDALLSSQRARYAKSGVVTSAGSALVVSQKTASDAHKDADIILYNGQTAAERTRSLALRYRMLGDAGLRDAAAQASMIESAAEMRSRAYLFSGASKAFSDISELEQQGVFA